MLLDHPILKDRRVRNTGIAAGIIAAHVAVFAVMGRAQPSPPLILPPPPLDVVLFRLTPPPPPPPPPPLEPSRTQGGGAPAAASRIHLSPRPPLIPPELTAPPEPAPEPTAVIGASPVTTAPSGSGLGGQGTGTGTGIGSGDGPGTGMGPMIIRGASSREIFEETPRDLRRRARGVDVTVSCEIRLDDRLTDCRVAEERPAGQGFGAVAIGIAERRFRVRPPRNGSGEAIPGRRITIGVIWP